MKLRNPLALATITLLTAYGCSSEPQPSAESHADHAPAATEIVADPTLPPLPIEYIGTVETLPERYPENWVLVDETSFFKMSAGKIIVLDLLEEKPARRIKGMMDKSLIGNFVQHPTRNEQYIMESFHERGSRGKKFDVLAIYDKTGLNLKKEIFWEETGTDRLQALPERYSMAVSGDGELLFVANFNPAASFTVVDLETHEIVSTIGTPGCVLTYPTGPRSVSSLCSNGSMLTTVVGADGTLARQQRIEPFFDTDKTPIFERPAIIDGIAYFPSFTGTMHVVDMSGELAEYRGSWDMLTEQEAAANHRPSGLSFTDYDDQGHFYTIMQADGGEGTQSHGGHQVWVFDPIAQKKVAEIDLPNWGISMAVTRGEKPLLVVTNGELQMDVFDASSGEHIQTIGDIGSDTPLLIHKAL